MRSELLLTALAVFILTLVAIVTALSYHVYNKESAPPVNRTITMTDPPMNNNLTHPFFTLTSPAFMDGGTIPATFTCDGSKNLSPPLGIAGTPPEARSLVLIMDDHDVPKQLKPDGVFDHWVLFNIPPLTTEIPQGEAIGIAGANGSGQHAYTGPCPPTQYEPREHRYIFTLYALDAELPLREGASKNDVLEAMKGHIIAQAQLVGRYQRK